VGDLGEALLLLGLEVGGRDDVGHVVLLGEWGQDVRS
jgi:hypothetical protein